MDDLGLLCDPSFDLAPAVQTYGEAHVVQPETTGSTIHQYTTYLVQAKLAEDNYSCRKRYSDFEWLRAALTACFPGVRIPPLPKKHGAAQGVLSKTGRYEDAAFIETRRAGLEVFMQRCMRKKELCVDSQILKRFLGTTTEEAIDELKRKIDGVSVVSKCQKYGQIYAEFKEASLPADDRIEPCKLFLTTQKEQLRELADGFKEVVDAQELVTKALSGAQTKLATISHAEAGTLEVQGVAKEARGDLVAGLRQQCKVMQASPALHYDLLLAATERELLEVEAMQEAFDSVDLLHRDLLDARDKASVMGQILKQVLDGGEIPSTGTGMARMLGIAPKKDREERIVEMKSDYEQKQKEVAATEEFHRLARTVLICMEIGSFFKDKVAGHHETKDTFAALSQKSAATFGSIWAGAGTSSPSHGYPGAAALAPEADVEYE